MKLDSNLRYRVVAVEVNCEACDQGYRLNPDGLHYNHNLNDSTWGVCRRVVAALNDDHEYHWLDRATNRPLIYANGDEARFNSLDEAIQAFIDGRLSASRNEVLA